MRPALPAPSPKPSPKPTPTPRAGGLKTSSPQAVQPGESPAENRRIGLLLVLGVVVGLLVQFWPQVRKQVDATLQVLQDRRTAAEVQQPQEHDPPPAKAAALAIEPQAAEVTGAAAIEGLTERVAPALSALIGAAPLQKVAGLSSEAMQVALTPAGEVLMTSKYAVLELGAGESSLRRLLYSPAQYREQFPEAHPQAMASSLLLADGRYLLGGWHGEVLLGQRGVLRRLSAREQRPQGRITELLAWKGQVLLAGDGFWRLVDGGRALQEIHLPGASRIAAVGVGARQLLLADSGRRLLAWDGQVADLWPLWSEDAGRIQTLRPARDGGWWVGTTRGLYRIDERGNRPQVLLKDVWVTDLAEHAGERWVGTWKQGLLLWRDGRWYRLGAGPTGLADDSVSALAIDSRRRLWLALYGGGGWSAPLAALREHLMEHAWTPVPDARE